jgi:subtilase family protein
VKAHRLERPQLWRLLLAAAIAVGGVVISPTTGGASTAAAETPPIRVIVQAEPGGLAALSDLAAAVGGRVVITQPSLDTAVVDVPAAAVGQLRSAAGIRAVTPDTSVRLNTAGVGPTGEAGDLTNVAGLTGASTFWRNGFSGQGVDVALLDSGVVPVQGLMTPNKLVIGPDLSFESQLPNLRHLDTFGHGTHLAGIIAGRDAGTNPATYATDNTHFLGMAPGSRVVSLKLADAQGNTDVSQVIAGIDWVVRHAHDAGLNIRVLNLSFGTDSVQDYQLDPLAHAAEVAWNRGIVVVVSAGNGGDGATGLANPAYDPAVLAVGAQDPKGTQDRSDDTVPTFSRRGAVAEGKRAPDLVAPGTSLVSLRSPGSFVDIVHGDSGRLGDRFFRGSGTSQSAAVVSGAAALLLSQRPQLNPDQVKDLLRRTARPIANVPTDAQGAGALDLTAAYSTPGRTVSAAKINAGGGSLDKARGRFKVKKNGVVLTGEQDIFGQPADTGELGSEETSGSYDGATWAAGGWLGSPAMGAVWTGATWAGATWAGATWAGATWAGATWAGATWAGATWAGATWAGATWAGATWADAEWADAEWANALWSSAGWE